MNQRDHTLLRESFFLLFIFGTLAATEDHKLLVVSKLA